MKKILFALLFGLFAVSGYADVNQYRFPTTHFSHVDPSLERIAYSLYRFPDAVKLIQEMSKGGPVSLKAAPLGTYCDAYWERVSRSIVINTSSPKSQGEKICSILFEMHNALSTPLFSYWDNIIFQGKISKPTYVETIERIEYDNARKTCALIERGIQQGYLPFDARWPIARSFAEHYRIQQEMGHSALIARHYDQWVKKREAAKVNAYAYTP